MWARNHTRTLALWRRCVRALLVPTRSPARSHRLPAGGQKAKKGRRFVFIAHNILHITNGRRWRGSSAMPQRSQFDELWVVGFRVEVRDQLHTHITWKRFLNKYATGHRAHMPSRYRWRTDACAYLFARWQDAAASTSASACGGRDMLYIYRYMYVRMVMYSAL